MHRWSTSGDRTSIAPESTPLCRTRQLLDEARQMVELARSEAAQSPGEPSRALDENVREMEALLARTERQAAQLASVYVAVYQLHTPNDALEERAAVTDVAVTLLRPR